MSALLCVGSQRARRNDGCVCRCCVVVIQQTTADAPHMLAVTHRSGVLASACTAYGILTAMVAGTDDGGVVWRGKGRRRRGKCTEVDKAIDVVVDGRAIAQPASQRTSRPSVPPPHGNARMALDERYWRRQARHLLSSAKTEILPDSYCICPNGPWDAQSSQNVSHLVASWAGVCPQTLLTTQVVKYLHTIMLNDEVCLRKRCLVGLATTATQWRLGRVTKICILLVLYILLLLPASTALAAHEHADGTLGHEVLHVDPGVGEHWDVCQLH